MWDYKIIVYYIEEIVLIPNTINAIRFLRWFEVMWKFNFDFSRHPTKIARDIKQSRASGRETKMNHLQFKGKINHPRGRIRHPVSCPLFT